MRTVARFTAASVAAIEEELEMIRSCREALGLAHPSHVSHVSLSRRRERRLTSWGPRRLWTAAEDLELRRLYPDTPTVEIAQRFCRKLGMVYGHAQRLGLAKSAAYMASPAACRLRRDDAPGIAFRYPKGHVPANKGLRRPGYAPGRMAVTQFRKGERPHTWVPVGTEVRDPDGYLKRKISDDRTRPSRFNWRFVHTLVWEAKNGPVPRGHAVAFKNRDNGDIRDENLELVTRQELMRRNSVHNLPKELAQVVQLRGALVRQIRKRATA